MVTVRRGTIDEDTVVPTNRTRMGVVPAVVPAVGPNVAVVPRLDMAVPCSGLLSAVVAHGSCTLRLCSMTSLLPGCGGLVGRAGFLPPLLSALIGASLLSTLLHPLLLLLALGTIGLLLCVSSTLLLCAASLRVLFTLASGVIL